MPRTGAVTFRHRYHRRWSGSGRQCCGAGSDPHRPPLQLPSTQKPAVGHQRGRNGEDRGRNLHVRPPPHHCGSAYRRTATDLLTGGGGDDAAPPRRRHRHQRGTRGTTPHPKGPCRQRMECYFAARPTTWHGAVQLYRLHQQPTGHLRRGSRRAARPPGDQRRPRRSCQSRTRPTSVLCTPEPTEYVAMHLMDAGDAAGGNGDVAERRSPLSLR